MIPARRRRATIGRGAGCALVPGAARCCLRLSVTLLLLVLTSGSGRAQQRIHLTPHYRQGLTLRYALDFKTTAQNTATGGIQNPQAPSQVETTVSAVVRIDILAASADPAHPNLPRVRMRTTYERIDTKFNADVPDPQFAENQAQYKQLEGKSIEFTQDAGGAVTEIKGLDEYTPEVRAAFTEWLGRLSLGVALPAQGIAIGDKWSPPAQPRSQPIPIEGIIFQTESTYLRNEACRNPQSAAAAAPAGGSPAEECAVILTRFGITQRNMQDQTPEEYRKRGLRTGGRMSGGAESLTYVSLATGFVVSVTQDGTEESDVTIVSQQHQLRMRYEGKMKTRSQISLLP